jgi:hypothetical protein
MAAPTLIKHDKKFWEILGILSWPILPQAQIVLPNDLGQQ